VIVIIANLARYSDAFRLLAHEFSGVGPSQHNSPNAKTGTNDSIITHQGARNMRRVISGFIAVVALIGCAASEFVPVKDPTVRIEAYGCSILPPLGPDWYRRPDLHLRGLDGVVFAKQSGSTTHNTIGAMVLRRTGFNPASIGFAEYATNPEVFAAYVKATAQQAHPPGSRMRFLEHSVVPDTQFGYCAKEHAKFENRGSPFAPQVLIQEDWSFSCLHPNSSRVMIQIGFSERGLPGESDPSLTNVREQFLRSLQFRPLLISDY
jgi:hypothetical protein